jgi:hypothetical protein
MGRSIALVAALLVSAALGAGAVEPVSGQPASAPVDNRQLVPMPPGAQALLRQDMVDNMVVLNGLLAHLAAAQFEQASELAEARLGVSSMGRHRGTGMGPGRFMPPEMHQLAIGMHQSATDLAGIAKTKDRSAADAALLKVTSFCVACHLGFRIR